MRIGNQSMRALTGMMMGLGVLGLTACGDDKRTTVQDNIDETAFVAQLNLSDSVIPFPNDILFSGTADGTLNIPVDDPTDYSDPQVALNALDGFSTIAPITTTFSSAIDSATLVGGSTVRVFQVTTDFATKAVTGITAELAVDVDYALSVSTVDAESATLVISPLKPLAPKSSYLVALSNGIKNTDGTVATADFHYTLAKADVVASPIYDTGSGTSNYTAFTDAEALSFYGVQQLVNVAEATVEGYTITADVGDAITDLAASDIVLSWSFTTQSVGDVLGGLQASASAQTMAMASMGINTSAVNSALPGVADLYYGSLDVPYYLTNATAASTDPLSKFWLGVGDTLLTQLNITPVATSTETIPVMMSLPNAGSGQTKPGTGWKVVIFQHGITQDRTNVIAIADTLAAAGFAAIAIDLPLHGITDHTGNPLSAGAGNERTFDLDLVDNVTGLSATDGVIDESGKHFINLANLVVTRDNLRQAVSDLFTLNASLDGVNTALGANTIDTSQVYFIGHSLGAMVGSVFLALEPSVQDAVLGMPGGGIAKLLDGSATFGPELSAGLALEGVDKGSADYESFLGAAQTVIDSGDPLNYAAATSTGRGVLLFEVVGDDAASLPDQVVPNNVYADAPSDTVPSPTAGTDPLATAMGLTQYGTTQAGAVDLKAWVRFLYGHHGSLLSPYDALDQPDAVSASVTTEMQTQVANFLGSFGTALVVTDGTLVEAP